MSTTKSSRNPIELFMTGWGDAFPPLQGNESLLGLGEGLNPLDGVPRCQGTSGPPSVTRSRAPRGGYSSRD